MFNSIDDTRSWQCCYSYLNDTIELIMILFFCCYCLHISETLSYILQCKNSVTLIEPKPQADVVDLQHLSSRNCSCPVLLVYGNAESYTYPVDANWQYNLSIKVNTCPGQPIQCKFLALNTITVEAGSVTTVGI